MQVDRLHSVGDRVTVASTLEEEEAAARAPDFDRRPAPDGTRAHQKSPVRSWRTVGTALAMPPKFRCSHDDTPAPCRVGDRPGSCAPDPWRRLLG
ncbi:hypothetical protein ACE1SV_73830 [Streptomyces sennicomposti]